LIDIVWFAVKEEEAARLKGQAPSTSTVSTSTRSKEEERIQREEMRRELQGEK
jgi:hypothetical protein